MEIIDTYVQKVRGVLGDLHHQIMILESHITVKDQEIAGYLKQIEDLKDTIEKMAKAGSNIVETETEKVVSKVESVGESFLSAVENAPAEVEHLANRLLADTHLEDPVASTTTG